MMRLTDRLLERYEGNIEVEFAGEIVRDSPIEDAFEVWLDSHPSNGSINQRTYDFNTIREALYALYPLGVFVSPSFHALNNRSESSAEFG